MKILNLALPYLAYGAIKDKKNRYDVTEYNVNELNFINLVDSNPDVTSWSYDVPAFPNTNFFSIQQNGAEVNFRVTEELDRETTGKSIEVHVKSKTANGEVSTDDTINVRVTDVNDNAPVFDKKTLTMTIPENAEAGFEVGQLVASDADTGKFARIVYSLAEEIAEFKPRDPAKRSQFERAFTVESDGRVVYKGGFADLLDAETSSRIELKVYAEDDIKNDVHGTTKQVLEIRISDINDQAPVIDFDGQPRSVSEGADAGTVVLTLTATDADVEPENNNVAFEVDSPDFAFEGNNLVVNGKLDYETKNKYVLKVTAFNPNAVNKDQISSVTVIVDIEDANDPPAFINFRQDTIPKEGEQINDLVIGKIIADDGDTGSQALTYSIEDPAGIFTVDSISGEIIANGILDREYDIKNADDLENFGEIVGHSFVVTISDDGFPPAKTEQIVTVRVEDIPDESILWQPKTVSLCETTDVIAVNRLFFAIAPDASDEIMSMEVTNVPGLSIFETQKGHFFADYNGKESSTTDMLAGLEFIELSVTTALGVESVQVAFSICSCNNAGELEGACHAGKAGPGVGTFPWWIVVLIVVIVTIVIVLALFVRRKPEGKLEEGMQDPENMTDHDHLLSPDDMGSEQKAPLPKILEEPTDNLGNIIRDAKQQADNEEQVPNTLLQFEYEGRNSMISNMSDLSDGDDTEQDIDLDKLPESVKRNFEGSKYNEL